MHFGAGAIYGTGCHDDYSIHSCLTSFSYTPGSAPVFSSYHHVHDEMTPSAESWNTGVSYSLTVASYYGSDYHYSNRWTPKTQTYVLSAMPAVPEPEQYAMLGLGLAGLLAFSRRKRG